MDIRYNTQHEITEATWLVNRILSEGVTISVNDGEEWVVRRSTDAAVILEAMGSTDNDTLVARDKDGKKLGFFWLIYGNSSGELPADGTDNEFCNRICNEYSEAFPL